MLRRGTTSSPPITTDTMGSSDCGMVADVRERARAMQLALSALEKRESTSTWLKSVMVARVEQTHGGTPKPTQRIGTGQRAMSRRDSSANSAESLGGGGGFAAAVGRMPKDVSVGKLLRLALLPPPLLLLLLFEGMEPAPEEPSPPPTTAAAAAVAAEEEAGAANLEAAATPLPKGGMEAETAGLDFVASIEGELEADELDFPFSFGGVVVAAVGVSAVGGLSAGRMGHPAFVHLSNLFMTSRSLHVTNVAIPPPKLCPETIK